MPVIGKGFEPTKTKPYGSGKIESMRIIRLATVALAFLPLSLSAEPIAAFNPPKGWELKEQTQAADAELSRYLPAAMSYGMHSEIIEQRSVKRELSQELVGIRSQFREAQCTVDEDQSGESGGVYRFLYACPSKRAAGFKEIHSTNKGRVFEFTYEKEVREWPLSEEQISAIKNHLMGRVKLCETEKCATDWNSKFQKLEALKK